MDVYNLYNPASNCFKGFQVILMGLPTTLSGMIGFLIFIMFIIAISASDVYPDQTKQITDAQNNFIANFNSTINQTATADNPGFWGTVLGITGLDGIYNFITNFFSMIVSFVIMVGGYILLFFGVSTTLPKEVYVLFAIFGSSLIIGIVKLIFFSGD